MKLLPLMKKFISIVMQFTESKYHIQNPKYSTLCDYVDVFCANLDHFCWLGLNVFDNHLYTLSLQVQFIGLASHTIIFMCLTNCDYPSGMKTVHVTYMLSLTVLFSNFYMQSYLKKGKKKSTAEPSSGSDIHKKSQ